MSVEEYDSIEKLIDKATTAFKTKFDNDPKFAACSPGRVNLIGEHTDYNDGFVLPMALPMMTIIVGNQTNRNICRVMTLSDKINEPTFVTFDLPGENNILHPGIPKWANYIKGVVSYFKGNIPAFDACVISSVPLGSGLSSSAALEVAMYTFLEAMTNSIISTQEKALLCQKAEHNFAHMPCGIMDQLIVSQAKEDHALLIDCRSLETKLIPINDPSIIVLIINSNVHHELTGSEYPTRRKQCEEGAKILGKMNLRDATFKELNDNKSKFGTDVFNRIHHVVKEISRTEEGAVALIAGNYNRFGSLMNESHNSLRDYYEVSCPELDELVDAVREVPGVFGSRMTGGGFGGCTVTLLKKESVELAIKHVKEKFSGKASFYIAKASEGARILKIA